MTRLATLFLFILCQTGSQHPGKHVPGANNKQQAAQHDQSNPDTVPLLVKLANTGKTAKESAQDSARIRAEERSNVGTLVLTALLVIANLGMVGVAIWQRQTLDAQRAAMVGQETALNNTIKKMGEVSDKQSADMAESIAESRRMVGRMRDTARRQLRAYVEVKHSDEGSSVSLIKDEDRWRFQSIDKVVNTGQTPAYGMLIIGDVQHHPIPLPSGFLIPETADNPEGRSVGVLGSHQDRTIRAKSTGSYTLAEIEAIRTSEQTAFYLFGRITYRDIYGGRHWTTFCERLTWTGGSVTGGELTDTHNEMNEEPKD